VQRFDADYLFKVKEHSAARNQAVTQVLPILSYYGANPPDARVDRDRAHLQAIKGDE
jgi:hypothetical protein